MIVYLSDVQPEPDSQIDGRDLEPVDNVLISASRHNGHLRRTVRGWDAHR